MTSCEDNYRDIKGTYPVGTGGRYELYPATWSDPLEKGRLLIYPNDVAVAPVVGMYEQKKAINMDGKEVVGYHFAYNNKEYLYFIHSGVLLMTRDVMPSSVDMVEDVTGVCPIALPQRVEVYRVQQIKFAY